MCSRLRLRLCSQCLPVHAGDCSCAAHDGGRFPVPVYSSLHTRARTHAHQSATSGRRPAVALSASGACNHRSCLAHDGGGRARRPRLQAPDSSTSSRSSRGSSGAAVSQTQSLSRPRGGFCLATLHQGRVLSEPLPLHRSAPVRSAQRLRALAPARSALGTHLRRRLSALPLPAAVASHPAAFATLGLAVLRPVPPAR
jgi:hypothetical protein